MTFSSPAPWGKSAGGLGGVECCSEGGEVEVLETVREIEMERERWSARERNGEGDTNERRQQRA